jgi:hypothetical protein
LAAGNNRLDCFKQAAKFRRSSMTPSIRAYLTVSFCRRHGASGQRIMSAFAVPEHAMSDSVINVEPEAATGDTEELL